jgi:hypothetical protein
MVGGAVFAWSRPGYGASIAALVRDALAAIARGFGEFIEDS